MRRLLSLLLSAVMVLSMFSVLGVVASADSEADTEIGTDVPPEIGDGAEGGDDIGGENVPEGDLPEAGEGEDVIIPEDKFSLKFIPANKDDYKLYPYTMGGFSWEYDEELGTFDYVYNYILLDEVFGEGNQLVFTDAEGVETTYVCDEEWWFVDENGEYLDEEPLDYYVEEDEEGNLVLYIEYGDLSCEYPYEFLESDIDYITPINEEPILLEAYRDGYYDRIISGIDEGELSFFYDTVYNESFGFVIAYKDGTERVVSYDDDNGLVFEDTGEEIMFFELAEKNSQTFYQWAPAAVYTVEYYYEGVPFEVEFEVSENPVVSVDYVQMGEAGVLHYGVNGEYFFCEHDDCGNVYFEFSQTDVFPADGDIITVTYVDGTSKVLRWENGWLKDSENNTYNDYICLYDDQYENHWTDGEYSFNIKFFGCDDEVTVTVEGREVESIDISAQTPVTVYENTDGMWTQDAEGNELFLYDYSLYTEGIEIIVSYDNGTCDTYYYDSEADCFVDEFFRSFPYEIVTSDKQLEEGWGLGENSITVEIEGFTADFNITVIESPVESIDFVINKTPVFGLEDEENGFWYTLDEEDEEKKFFYIWYEDIFYSEGNALVVNFKDGTSSIYYYDGDVGYFADDEGNYPSEYYPVVFRDRQVYVNWTPDSADNYIIVDFMGVVDYVPVVIDNGEKSAAAEIEGFTNTESGVQLTWSKVNNAEEYLIYRRLEKADGKASNNPWVFVGSTNEFSFVDSFELQDGAYYKYHIHTRNANGQSAYTGSVARTTRYLAPVEGFSVSNTKSGVVFNWKKVSGYTIHLFRLEKGASEWVYLGSKESDASYVCNVNAVSGKTYMYAAYYEKNGTSAIVYSDYITYLSEPHLKTVSNAVTGIYFNWTKVEGTVGYRVYRRAAGEKYFTYLGTTTNLWYCDNAVRNNNGTYYKYTVKAIAEDGSMSSYEGGLLLRRLVIPYIQSLTNNTNGITVKWAEIPGATSYRVYRRGAGQTTWTYLASVTGLTYTDTAVKNSSGNYYRYTVKAVVNGIFTSYNPDGPYTMRLSTPTLKSAVEVKNGIQVKWNAVKGAQSYQVYRKTADTTWVLIDTFSGTTYVDKTALPGVEYTYTVRAYKGSYRSSYIPAGVSAHLDIAE